MHAVALPPHTPSSGLPNPFYCAMHKKFLNAMPQCIMLHRSKGVFDVADETKVNEVEAVVEAVAAPVKAVADKAEEMAAPAVEAKPVKAKAAVRKPAARRVRKAPAKVVEAVKKVNKRAAKAARRAPAGDSKAPAAGACGSGRGRQAGRFVAGAATWSPAP